MKLQVCGVSKDSNKRVQDCLLGKFQVQVEIDNVPVIPFIRIPCNLQGWTRARPVRHPDLPLGRQGGYTRLHMCLALALTRGTVPSGTSDQTWEGAAGGSPPHVEHR